MINGAFTITRVTSNHCSDVIRIEVRGGERNRKLVFVELTPEQFAMALTGRSEVPCEYEIKPDAPLKPKTS